MWAVEYYEKENGDCPVHEFLLGLDVKQRAKADWQIRLLAERGTRLKEPYVKHFAGPLWELRLKFASDIQRIFYFAPDGDRFVLLHGFIKTTPKTPPREAEKAQTYYEDYQRRAGK